jgi:hypothetical protein
MKKIKCKQTANRMETLSPKNNVFEFILGLQGASGGEH